MLRNIVKTEFNQETQYRSYAPLIKEYNIHTSPAYLWKIVGLVLKAWKLAHNKVKVYGSNTATVPSQIFWGLKVTAQNPRWPPVFI